jgi:hypothetical protein
MLKKRLQDCMSIGSRAVDFLERRPLLKQPLRTHLIKATTFNGAHRFIKCRRKAARLLAANFHQGELRFSMRTERRPLTVWRARGRTRTSASVHRSAGATLAPRFLTSWSRLTTAYVEKTPEPKNCVSMCDAPLSSRRDKSSLAEK